MWEPDLSGKQWEVLNCYDRALLVSGGRLSGKSWSCLHRIVRHMYETPDARVGMFSKVMKNSKDAGLWKNLHRYTLPEWIKANIGLNYTTKDYDEKPGPKVDGTTRTPYFRISNMHGGESECMLFSLSNPNEAEATLKEREFSLIYFSELSNFPERSVLSLGLMCLRMPYLGFHQQQWMADTNPAPEAEDSWIYEVWYIERCQDYADYVTRQRKLNRPLMKEETFISFKNNLRLIEINAEDNQRLSRQQFGELESTYSYDVDLYNRFVKGKWAYGGAGAGYHLRRFFRPNIHIVGSCEGQDEEQWEVINPTANCHSIITGFDVGETNNHAGVILQKHMMEQWLPESKRSVRRAYFSVVDELVSLNEFITIENYAIEFMRLITTLEEIAGREYNLDLAYSDSSTLTKWSAASSQFPSEQIEAASFGRLRLIGVDKRKFSPHWRVQILQQLLAFNRIKVSAHCFHTIRMFKELKRGTGKLNFILQSDDNRHIFDALTYAIAPEIEEEAVTMAQSATRRGGLMVSIR